MHPRQSGQAFLPRFGGGYMHQFGHVYALQQELLDPSASNWFRATELWHTARQEGLALNCSHYTNILRQCVMPGAWEQTLLVLQQLKRENLRPDVVGVGCAMAACTEARQPRQVEAIFQRFEKTMMLDSVCYLALIRSRAEAGEARGAIEAGQQQERAGVPFLPYTYQHLLEAANVADDSDYATVVVRRMEGDEWLPTSRTKVALVALSTRHPRLRALVMDGNLLDAEERRTLEALPPSDEGHVAGAIPASAA